MSDEVENLPDVPDAAPVAEAPSAPMEAPQSQPVNVYDAFKALPDFQGREDVDIARSLYSSYTGLQEAQRQLQQYQTVVPMPRSTSGIRRSLRLGGAPRPKPPSPSRKRLRSGGLLRLSKTLGRATSSVIPRRVRRSSTPTPRLRRSKLSVSIRRTPPTSPASSSPTPKRR